MLQRRDQGLPGVRRQAGELRRSEDRRDARREERGEGRRHAPSPSSPTPGGSAKKALDALPIVWDEGRQRATCRAPRSPSTSRKASPRPTTNGDRKRRRRARRRSRARRRRSRRSTATPFLAHACMEPMNCTVRLTADKAEGWVPTQNAGGSLAALSEASGLPLAQVRGAPPRPRRRLRPARRHAGLRAPGGRHRQGVPRHARSS